MMRISDICKVEFPGTTGLTEHRAIVYHFNQERGDPYFTKAEVWQDLKDKGYRKIAIDEEGSEYWITYDEADFR